MDRQEKLDLLAKRAEPKPLEVDDKGLLDGLESKLEDLTGILDKGVTVDATELLERLKTVSELEDTLNQSQLELKEALKPKPAMQLRTKVKGSITYVATAPVGTKPEEPLWKAMKIDETEDIVISFADGNAEHDNPATDLDKLRYL